MLHQSHTQSNLTVKDSLQSNKSHIRQQKKYKITAPVLNNKKSVNNADTKDLLAQQSRSNEKTK